MEMSYPVIRKSDNTLLALCCRISYATVVDGLSIEDGMCYCAMINSNGALYLMDDGKLTDLKQWSRLGIR